MATTRGLSLSRWKSYAATTVITFQLGAGCADALTLPKLSAQGGWMPYSSPIDIDGDTRLHAKPAPTYAVGLGWPFGDALEVFARWQQVTTAVEVHASPASAGNLDAFSLTFGARYLFLDRDEVLRPWLDVGAGWYRGSVRIGRQNMSRTSGGNAIKESIVGRGDAAGVTAAAGVDFRLSRPLSLMVEVRYNWASDIDFVTPLAGFSLDLDIALNAMRHH
jgi:hypothetical protein